MTFISIFILSLLAASDINYPTKDITDDWIALDDEKNMWIGYTYKSDINWARTISTLPFNIKQVSDMIEDLENYHHIFDRVKSSNVVNQNVVHIRIDMPFPISDRDYIVSYSEEKKDNEISYKFKAVDNLNIPVIDGCIRLVNAAGEWYLKQLNDLETKVVYTWNGELRGDFPDWALTKAWETQGSEMINWLEESLNEKYK